MQAKIGGSLRSWLSMAPNLSLSSQSFGCPYYRICFSSGRVAGISRTHITCCYGDIRWRGLQEERAEKYGFRRHKLWRNREGGSDLGIGSERGARRELTTVAAKRGFLTELQSLKDEANAAGPLEFESPLQIVLYPDPRLRAKNKSINVFDQKLQQLVQEMFDLMYKTDGVGLSAPQVGVNVRLMVYNPVGERGKGEEFVLVNPRIVKYGKNRDVFTEGCLSFPRIEADVERPLSVRVDAQDIKGKKFSINLKEWQARIFQHEYDHLEGTLYFDRMTPEVLDTICADLQKLEDAYEQHTGLPAPEKINNKQNQI